MSNTTDLTRLEKLATLIRHYILTATTNAGSGHPTSSLSAVELMTALLFGGFFRYNPEQPQHPNNDRLIFSKGHATPLFYALWVAAGALPGEEMAANYRKFGSPLEGHPTVTFPHVEAATGSLGQGLSVGVGMALNGKYLDKLPYRTYVLLGDSEMAEGSVWEALEVAAHYHLDNLVGIVDINRLGQRGETMYGHDVSAYVTRAAAFGWETIAVDGHSLPEIMAAYTKAQTFTGGPVMILAKTIKGKGVSLLEDKNGWHGKALSREDCDRSLAELGEVDLTVRGELSRPEDLRPTPPRSVPMGTFHYPPQKPVATRKAYGNALARLGAANRTIVSLDGEVSNSTMAEIFAQACPNRFFEMFIAEQNMAGAALGLASRGKVPFVSSFAAFLTRAFDQIRMSQYSDPNLKFVGSHAGVSIGWDGPSQMGLEDLAMFRTLVNGVVLYPADAVTTERLMEEMVKHRGIMYMRTTREATPILYNPDEQFSLGGCKVLRHSGQDRLTVVSAGVTLFEALAAYELLKKIGIFIRIIDLYSIKPIAAATLADAARKTGAIVTVEDHYPEGGLGEAVMNALATIPVPVYSLAVTKKPKSGAPTELLDYEEISRRAIVDKVKEVLGL
ncbi:MAG: transketolase [Syntrophobacterales bacterium]|jgi:transketolase